MWQQSTHLKASQKKAAGSRLLPKEADGANLETESLVGISEVVQHDVDDGQLVDAWSVDLQHASSVTLLQLKNSDSRFHQHKRTSRHKDCL